MENIPIDLRPLWAAFTAHGLYTNTYRGPGSDSMRAQGVHMELAQPLGYRGPREGTTDIGLIWGVTTLDGSPAPLVFQILNTSDQRGWGRAMVAALREAFPAARKWACTPIPRELAGFWRKMQAEFDFTLVDQNDRPLLPVQG